MAVIMRVPMIMIMVVPVAMAMGLVVGMRVVPAMRVVVAVTGLRIGALFGREGRVARDNAGAEPLEHGNDDVILADPQSPVQDLDRQMPVAEMPSQTRQGGGAVRLDVADLLVRGRHLDDAAVVEDQSVAGPQDPRFGQVQQEVDAVVGRQRDPAPVAAIEIERRDPDPALARPGPAGDGFDGAPHDQNRK
jgi:hypothetical protein